jgi:glycosyltransferase involved in cell wall biosynthesis
VCADPGIPVSGLKGSSVHVREMVAAFEELGHEVVLFCVNSGNPVEAEPYPKLVSVGRGPSGGGIGSVTRNLDKQARQWVAELERLALNLKLRRLIHNHSRDNPFNMIYERYSLFHFGGLTAARRLGIPHLLELNAPLCYEEEHMRTGLNFRVLAGTIEELVLRNTHHVLAVSDVLRSFAVDAGTNPNCVSVIPNGVTAKRFCLNPGASHDLRIRLGLLNKIVIGFVSSLKSWHGTALLLDAFSALSQLDHRLHLLIVGDGPQRKMLEDRIEERRLAERVTLTGAVRHKNVPDYIAAMDIAVAPYDRSDFFYFSPVKIFEYLAMGTPVVAARIGQIEKILRDGETGILVEPGDVVALREALSLLIGNPDLRVRIGMAGRAWVLRERTWRHNAKLAAEIAIEGLTAGALHRS